VLNPIGAPSFGSGHPLVTAYLEFAELQAIRQNPMDMKCCPGGLSAGVLLFLGWSVAVFKAQNQEYLLEGMQRIFGYISILTPTDNA